MPGIPYVTPILQVMRNISREEADINDVKAQTQQRIMQIAMGSQAMKAEEQRQQGNEMYRQFMIRQLVTGNPNQTNPQTTSIDESQSLADSRNPQMAELRTLQQQKAEYQRNLQFALGADPQYQRIWQDAVEKTDTRIREVTKEVVGQRQKDNETLVNIGRTVDSPESLQNFIRTVGEVLGPGEAFNLDKRLKHDAQGNPIWNDQIKAQVLDPYLRSRMSAAQAHQIAQEQMAAKEAARKEQKDRIEKLKSDAQIAHLQAGTDRLLKEEADGGKAESDVGKLTDDLKKGRITQEQFDLAMGKKFRESRSAEQADEIALWRAENPGMAMGIPSKGEKSFVEWQKEREAKAKAGTAKEPDVADEIKAILAKNGIKFEPDKYTYRITPDGQVQRKAK